MRTLCGAGMRFMILSLPFSQARDSLAFSLGPLQPPRNSLHVSAAGATIETSASGSGGHGPQESAVETMSSRLQALQRVAATISLTAAGAVAIGAGGGLGFPEEARAAKSGVETGQREWISGKGAQPKGSDDKTGTRKETKYLRCLSNCLADCQKPTYGPEKDREECLQTCQDECCTSYEQCTYTVTQNK